MKKDYSATNGKSANTHSVRVKKSPKKIIVVVCFVLILAVCLILLVNNLLKPNFFGSIKFGEWNYVTTDSTDIEFYSRSITAEHPSNGVIVLGDTNGDYLDVCYLRNGVGTMTGFVSSNSSDANSLNRYDEIKVVGYIKESDIQDVSASYHFENPESLYDSNFSTDIIFSAETEKSGMLFYLMKNESVDECESVNYVLLENGVAKANYSTYNKPDSKDDAYPEIEILGLIEMVPIDSKDYSLELPFSVERNENSLYVTYSGVAKYSFPRTEFGFCISRIQGIKNCVDENMDGHNSLSFISNHKVEITTYDYFWKKDAGDTFAMPDPGMPEYELSILGYIPIHSAS